MKAQTSFWETGQLWAEDTFNQHVFRQQSKSRKVKVSMWYCIYDSLAHNKAKSFRWHNYQSTLDALLIAHKGEHCCPRASHGITGDFNVSKASVFQNTVCRQSGHFWRCISCSSVHLAQQTCWWTSPESADMPPRQSPSCALCGTDDGLLRRNGQSLFAAREATLGLSTRPALCRRK